MSDSGSVMSNSLQPRGLQPARLLCQWNFPGKNTGVDCRFLLQEIFPTQGSNPSVVRLLRWYAHSLLCYLESPEKMMRRGNSKKEVPVFPGGANGKERVCQCRRHKRCKFDPWIRKIPWRKAWQPTPVFLPRESHGWSTLAGYRSQDCKESDMTIVTQHKAQLKVSAPVSQSVQSLSLVLLFVTP